jgi:integrase
MAGDTTDAPSTPESPIAIAGELLPAVAPSIALGREVALSNPERLLNAGTTFRGIEALARSTRRAYLSDWISFLECCRHYRLPALPASRRALETFIEWRTPFDDKKPAHFHYVGADDPFRRPVAAATLRRALAAIAAVHVALQLLDPTTDPEVQHALTTLTKGRRAQRSKAPLRWEAIEQALSSMSTNNLRTLRDKALVAVAHSTMLRRAELVALQREQYERQPTEDFGRIRVGETKTTDGSVLEYRHVSAEAARHLEAWLSASGITVGPIFRGILPDERFRTRIRLDGTSEAMPLEAGQVSRIFKQIAQRAQLDRSSIGGHSTRIGAAHDLKAFGANTHDIMQDGGWQTPAMVKRYTAGFSADEGAMARMARERRRRR